MPRHQVASAEPIRIERRSGQRFGEYQIPVLLRTLDGRAGSGFTLNLSSRGALLWTDFPLSEGQIVDVTLIMPSEITMAEDVSVCCRARVLRRQPARDRGKSSVAVRIEHYEFLPRKVAPLHRPNGTGLHPSRI
jgi:hypothetical protein